MSRGDNQLPRVCFDDEYRVRVLEKENIEHTQELEQESNQFATSASLRVFKRVKLDSCVLLTCDCVCVVLYWNVCVHVDRAGRVPRDHQGRARGA